MGLKGYRLWAMGQLDSTCRAPPRSATAAGRRLFNLNHRRNGVSHQLTHNLHLRHHRLDVTAQVVFESKGLKPGDHFMGPRVETRRLSSYGPAGFNLHKPHLDRLGPVNVQPAPRCSAAGCI
jgi:hypothetical protein